MGSVLRFFLLIFLLLAGFAIIGIYWTFIRPLPNYSTTIGSEQLRQPVDVHRDSYGVPYIYAQNEDDLYFAAGYVHAQERLWQMTLSQISAEGRFSEFFGEELIDLDKYQRTLGFWDTAKRIEQESDPLLIGYLQSYADGINEFVRENRRNLPIEFTLLDMEPIEWTVTHSIALTRLMAWDQNIHWWSELTYAFLEDTLQPARLQELFPEYSDRYPTTLNDAQSRELASVMLPLIDREFERKEILSMEGTQVGSNAWAVDGSKTESGFPILSGDPHMGLSIPGFWFEVHYSTLGHRITGATIPGMPFVILGNNDHAAWSITNMMADVVDFFVEIPDTDDPSRYVTDDVNEDSPSSEPFRIRNEIIKVKGGDDVLFRIRETQHGPVVSDLLTGDSGLDDDRLISMAWTGNDVSHEGLAVYRMNHAGSMDDFENAVAMFRSPAMNITYADRDNNIAIFSAAGIPLRDFNPLLFRDGSDPDYSWNGYIPYSELPKLVNPEQGYVAHSNNKLHTDSYEHYIGSFWAPPSRIMRVGQFLENIDTLTVEIMQQMQFDSYSEHSREITEQILPMLRDQNNGEYNVVLSYLENWDYYYTPSSTAATIFDLFYLNLARNTLSDELGERSYETLSRLSYLPVRIIHRMLNNNSVFFNNTGTPENESREDIVRLSMSETIRQLEERFGDEPFDWRWENINTLTLRPPLLGAAAEDSAASGTFRMIVNNLFNKGPYMPHGHSMSVNKAEYAWDKPFEVFLGPSIRRIVDLSNTGRSLTVLPTGQSGNPLSTHYGDQTEMWLEGRYRYIYKDSSFFQQASYSTMKMIPVGSP
jgi:penicillin G amidase